MSLETLAITHAELSAEISEIQRAQSGLFCDRFRFDPGLLEYDTCIGLRYKEVGNVRQENGGMYSFDEGETPLCDACEKTRELKRKRVKLRIHLGQVRAAITRIGRRLKEQGQAEHSDEC